METSQNPTLSTQMLYFHISDATLPVTIALDLHELTSAGQTADYKVRTRKKQRLLLVMTLAAQNKSYNLLSIYKNKHYGMGLTHLKVLSHQVLFYNFESELAI